LSAAIRLIVASAINQLVHRHPMIAENRAVTIGLLSIPTAPCCFNIVSSCGH
jgi:hypothetical protein